MRRKISLYIGGQLADLDDQSFILFNYTTEELTNPTIVKNSISQQITLKGTPRNNKIFGDIYRNDRVTNYAAGQTTGIYFNPAVRTPFTIYNELGEILEDGYLKMDSVKRARNRVEYTCTLYGGLGSFLYGLSYKANGDKMTLADLDYGVNLDFTINRTAVSDAWARIGGDTSKSAKWDYINFAPCYNGKPSKPFDANKAVVHAASIGLTEKDGDYTTKDGFTLVTLSEAVTEQETKDYRSYLQRPVLRVKHLIDAICGSLNNGGYTVNLDADFFKNTNPYWEKSWISLPMLNDLNIDIVQTNGTETFNSLLNVITITGGGDITKTYSLDFLLDYLVRFSSVDQNYDYKMHLEDDWAAGQPDENPGFYFNWIEYTVVVLDGNGVTIQTNVFRISTAESPEGQGVPPMDMVVDYIGIEYDSGLGEYVGKFYKDGNPVKVGFTVSGIGYNRVVLNQQVCGIAYGHTRYNADSSLVWQLNSYDYADSAQVSAYSLNSGTMDYASVSSSTVRTGATIPQASLLQTANTPADYLLSFCKTFGLHLVCHRGEKVVDIFTRKNFYNGSSYVIVDINGEVDRKKDINKIPFVYDARWYSWSNKFQGDYAEYYADKYGLTYGKKRVNTGFDFDASEKGVTDRIIFNGCCDVMEASKYYCDLERDGTPIPAVFLGGGKFTLWKGGGESKSFDLPIPEASSRTWLNASYPMLDDTTRPQFHKADNAHLDLRDVLLFYNGNITPGSSHITLSDDTREMLTLNGNNPCWLPNYCDYDSTWLVSSMPRFGRYLYTGAQVTKSMDFGTPKEVSIAGATFAASSDIFTQYWQAYISDRYDDDSCVVTAFVDLRGMQVNAGLLRQFYFFDNAVWALNRIINYSLTTWGTVECEFVKVQDVTNYTS